jgi:phosphate transport system substrate-binding protein
MGKNFKTLNPRVSVSSGSAGTGSGFQKFVAGETDICNASRRITSKEEADCESHGVEYLEFQIAWDGLTVVVNKENDWARQLTAPQLKKIWQPDNPAQKWSDVDPSWPNEELRLFGPGPKSGTFDFFTEEVMGKARVSRTDYQASENDNDLVQGVAGNKFALGYFGMAYYEENKDKLTAVAIFNGEEFVLPSDANVLNGKYKPLSRPLFIYVNRASLKRPEVGEFVRFYLLHDDLVKQSLYVPVDNAQIIANQAKLDAALKN